MNLKKLIKNNIQYTEINKGLNIKNIKFISDFNKESKELLKFRLKAIKKLIYMKLPDWVYFEFPNINYDLLSLFFSVKVDNNLYYNKILDNLKLKDNKNILVDVIINSKNINSNNNKFINKLKIKLLKQGIIYNSFLTLNKKYNFLLNKYIGKIIPAGDNFFSCVNSCIFSEGTFIYIPKYINCLVKLGTYFKIINDKSGQFERTLIILSKNSKLNYIESCSAPNYYESQLHTAIVELIIKENSSCNYSTIQNWSKGSIKGAGGVYNLTTKRGMCLNNAELNWTQIEMGSFITWKYPCSILTGFKSKSSFYSLSLVSSLQIADTGGKMIHIGNYSMSKIVSKSIALNLSQSVYRGLLDIFPTAYFCKNNSRCDSLLIGNKALTTTLPYVKVYNKKSFVQQEAYISKIQKSQIFLMLQRGYSIKKALNILINVFCKSITTLLPKEYIIEFPLLLKSRIEEII